MYELLRIELKLIKKNLSYNEIMVKIKEYRQFEDHKNPIYFGYHLQAITRQLINLLDHSIVNFILSYMSYLLGSLMVHCYSP